MDMTGSQGSCRYPGMQSQQLVCQAHLLTCLLLMLLAATDNISAAIQNSQRQALVAAHPYII